MRGRFPRIVDWNPQVYGYSRGMDGSSRWHETRVGLTFLFWGWLAITLASALSILYSVWAFQVLESGFRAYQIGTMVFSACSLAGLAVCIVGVTRLFRAPVDARLGGIVAGALGCLVLFAVLELFFIVVSVPTATSRGFAMSWVSSGLIRPLRLAHAVSRAGGIILVVVMLYSIAKRVQALLPFWFGVIVATVAGFDVLLRGYMLFAKDGFRLPAQSPLLWLFLSIAMMVGQNALFLMLLAGTRRTLAASAGAGGAQVEQDWEGAAGWFGSAEWQAPTRGLGLYAGAVKALLLIVLGGYGGVVMAWVIELRGLATILAVGIPIGILIAQVIMIVGLAGFASVPLKSGARGLATAALVTHGLAVLLDIVSIVAVVMVLTHRSEYTYLAQRALGRAQMLSGFAQAVGLTGFMLLLSSLARVSRFVGAAELAAKMTPVMMMVIVTGGAVLLVRMVMGSPRIVENAGAGLLALALGVVLLALTALVMYLSFVNKVHAVLVEGPPEAKRAEEAWG
jgi:hypothetical protein